MFVSVAFGSKGKKYTGDDMFKVHEKMIREQGLGLEHFDAVAGHLVAAMKQLSVPQNLIDEATATVMTLRPVFDPAQNGTGQTPDSLYTRIGGATAVQGTLDVFYKKVLADPLLSPFFEGVDMEKQRKKQVGPQVLAQLVCSRKSTHNCMAKTIRPRCPWLDLLKLRPENQLAKPQFVCVPFPCLMFFEFVTWVL